MPTEKTTPPPTALPKAPTSMAAGAAAPSGKLTRQQRDALFNLAAKGMTPARQKKAPEDPVRPWIGQIIRMDKEGFSPAQIAAMAAAPGIELKISARAVKRLLVEHTKRKAATAAGAA